MNIDPSTTKYLIQARLEAEGIVEKPDVVGAVFGQTEGLLGEELDLRDLQKSGRIGRIEVDVQSKKGRSEGTILIPSSLDQVETSILAAALETIDRVGPCKATIKVDKVEDVRVTKRNRIIERARAARQGGAGAHAEADHEVPPEQDPRGPVRRDVRSVGPGLQGGVRVPGATPGGGTGGSS